MNPEDGKRLFDALTRKFPGTELVLRASAGKDVDVLVELRVDGFEVKEMDDLYDTVARSDLSPREPTRPPPQGSIEARVLTDGIATAWAVFREWPEAET